MAEITREQLEELKREVSYQIHRIVRDLKMTRKRPPGMLRSKCRLQFLFQLLREIEKDGYLRVVNDNELIIIGGEDDNEDGASLVVDEQ